MTLQRNWQ